MSLDFLISSPDIAEILELRFFEMLTAEITNQKALAVDAGKDPLLWDIDIFLERGYSFDIQEYRQPICVLTRIHSNEITGSSMARGIKKYLTAFSFVITAFGQSSSDGVGQLVGDKQAALNCQRSVRIIRNIIEAPSNSLGGYIDDEKKLCVENQTLRTINFGQLNSNENSTVPSWGAEILVEIMHHETVPQYNYTILNEIDLKIFNKEDSVLLTELTYT